MKKNIQLLLIALILTISSNAQTPCNDSLYLALKATNIDSITTRQYAYLLQKDSECNAYEAKRKDREHITLGISALIAVSFITTLIIVLPILRL